MDKLLSERDLSALKRKEKLTEEQKDSIEAAQRVEKEAFQTAKEEVDAALAYAPPTTPSSAVRRSASPSLPGFGFTTPPWASSRASPNGCSTPLRPPRCSSAPSIPRPAPSWHKNTLRNYGYFNGTVDYEVIPQKNPKKAKISYTVRPRNLFRLDSIAYLRFPAVGDSLIRETFRHRTLFSGDPFSVVNLDAERTRIYNMFRNSGYFYYKPEYITFRADTIQRPGFVQLQVVPAEGIPAAANRRYHLGKTTVRLFGNDSYQLTDTLHFLGYTLYYNGGKDGKLPLRFGALRRNMFYRRSMLYSQDIMSFVQQQLSGMDVFSSVNLKYVPRDTVAGNDTLDIEITAMLDKPYDGEFTTKVTSKSNGQIGPGLSFSMSKRNAFRGAEKLKFEVHGSYEWQTNSTVQGRSSVINSYEYGTSLSLDYPRLIFPGAHKFSRRARTSTSFVLDATWMNRANYFGMVSLSARMAYTYQSRPTIKHEIVPFRLDYDELLSTTATFDSIMRVNQALYVSMRDQFVPSMRYTFTYSSPRRARNPPHVHLRSERERQRHVGHLCRLR